MLRPLREFTLEAVAPRRIGRALDRARRRLRRRALRRPAWLVYLGILGPGLIAANAGNDAGAVATWSTAGADFGFDILWVLIPISLSLAVVQEMAARLGAITGKGLTDLIRERFGIRWTAFAMLTLLVANAGTTISEFAGIAAALELFGLSKFLTVPVAALALWYVVTLGSHRRIERFFLALTLGFFAYVGAAFLAHPDWGEVGVALVTPRLRLQPEFLFLLVALVGTTITPYMQVFVQASVVEKGVTPRDYPYTRVDVYSGSVFANLVVLFILVSTAATLHVSGIRVETAADAARALEPFAGPFATLLFGLGLLGASLLAAAVLPLSTAFAITEAFGFENGLSKDFREAPVFYALFTGLVALGALVTLIPGLHLIELLIAVQVLNGVLLPVILVFLTKLASDDELLGKWKNGRLRSVIAWTTTITVTAMIFVMLGSFVLRALGSGR